MPKFSVSITGVEVSVEDERDSSVLKDLALSALKEAYALEEATIEKNMKGNFPAVGFHSERDTTRPVKPEPAMATLNPEIKHGR